MGSRDNRVNPSSAVILIDQLHAPRRQSVPLIIDNGLPDKAAAMGISQLQRK